MKVLVLDNAVPLQPSPCAALRNALVRFLLAAGLEAEAVTLPCTPGPPARWREEMLVARSLRVPNTDRVIALAFPAMLVRHPGKVIWLQAVPAVMHDATRRGLAEARRVLAADASIADAIRAASGIEAVILAGLPDTPEVLLG